jgi:hypothetical protein
VIAEALTHRLVIHWGRGCLVVQQQTVHLITLGYWCMVDYNPPTYIVPYNTGLVIHWGRVSKSTSRHCTHSAGLVIHWWSYRPPQTMYSWRWDGDILGSYIPPERQSTHSAGVVIFWGSNSQTDNQCTHNAWLVLPWGSMFYQTDNVLITLGWWYTGGVIVHPQTMYSSRWDGDILRVW